MSRALLLLAALSATLPTRLGAQPAAPASAPQPEAPTTDARAADIRRLQQAIEALQVQLTESKRETADVQQALQALREQLEEEQALLAEQAATL